MRPDKDTYYLGIAETVAKPCAHCTKVIRNAQIRRVDS